MGLLERLSPQYHLQQLQRKQGVFNEKGDATLTGLLNYTQGKKATGRVIFGRPGYQGKLIATTSRLKSSYQGLRMPGAATAEAKRIAHPIGQVVRDIEAAYPHDNRIQSAVELFKAERNGRDEIVDSQGMRQALKVLAPLEAQVKAAKAAGQQVMALRFKNTDDVRTIPARAKQPTAQPSVSPMPASQPAILQETAEKLQVQKLDLRAAVAATATKFSRSDMQDAHELLVTYLKDPERHDDPVRSLLQIADEHAAARTRTIAHPWDMNAVGSINEGLEVLLKTPVMLMLQMQVPEAFEAVCSFYDKLPD